MTFWEAQGRFRLNLWGYGSPLAPLQKGALENGAFYTHTPEPLGEQTAPVPGRFFVFEGGAHFGGFSDATPRSGAGASRLGGAFSAWGVSPPQAPKNLEVCLPFLRAKR